SVIASAVSSRTLSRGRVGRVDADPEPHSARLINVGVSLRHGLLDGDRALDGVHDAAELGEDSVACRVNDTATMVSSHREEDCLVRFEITNSGTLVSADERAIAGDVGCEDRCQFPRSLCISWNIRHPGTFRFHETENSTNRRSGVRNANEIAAEVAARLRPARSPPSDNYSRAARMCSPHDGGIR